MRWGRGWCWREGGLAGGGKPGLPRGGARPPPRRRAGLGLEFLRHVERTKLLVHLVDGSRADPLGDVDTVNRELREYSAALPERPQWVVVNKIDVAEGRRRRPGPGAVV